MTKGAAEIIGFLIGVVIIVAVVVPIAIYLVNMGSSNMSYVSLAKDLESQRALESLDVVVVNNSVYIKNTGSVPIAINVLGLDTGSGCGSGISVVKVNPLLVYMNPGQISRNISSYDISLICFAVSTRGNAYAIKEKYVALSARSVSNIVPFTPSNLRFAKDIDLSKVRANYSIGSASCTTPGTPAKYIFQGYPQTLLTILDGGAPIKLQGPGYNCMSYRFLGLVNVSQSVYAVVVYYKLVVITGGSGPKSGMTVTVCIEGVSCASSTDISWDPSSIPSSYVVLEGFTVVPMSNAQPGIYNLYVSFSFYVQSSGSFNFGIEYIAFQGAYLAS